MLSAGVKPAFIAAHRLLDLGLLGGVPLMKKLFVQFYLLLFVCFLVMTMLVGLVYKFTAERAGRQSLDDLMKSSLYLMRSENCVKFPLTTGQKP